MPIRRKHVMVFGDLDAYLKHIHRPVEEHLVITPLFESMRKLYPKFKTKTKDVLTFFHEMELPVSLMLLDFYKDRAALVSAIETRLEDHFTSDETEDDQFLHAVYSVGKELVTIQFDSESLSESKRFEQSNFPAAWIPDVVTLQMKDGSKADMSEGTADMLDMTMFSWRKVNEIDEQLAVELSPIYGCQTILNTELINQEALHEDPKIKFHILVNPNWEEPKQLLTKQQARIAKITTEVVADPLLKTK